MKILLIANKPPYPPKDGGTIATLNMAKVLAEKNDVTVIALSTRKHKSSIDQIPKDLASKINFIYFELDTSLRLADLAINLFFRSTASSIERFYSKSIAQLICKVIGRENFDIIQLEGLYLVGYIEAIRKVSNKPIILRAHNVEHQVWCRGVNTSVNFLKKWYFNNLSARLKQAELQLVSKVDGLIAISSQDHEWFVSNGFSKPSTVIPVGFFLENYQNTNNVKVANAFAYIGALDWIPNQEGLKWFIEKVWPIVQARKPNSSLHIAGRNAPKWLINLFRSTPNIHFYGEIERSSDFIQKYDIAIVPLFSGSGMRVKVIELMLNQVVVISTQKGVEGISGDITEYAFIADDPEGFANHMIQLQINHDYATSTRIKAYNFAISNFDSSKHIEQLTSYYNNITNGI